MTSDRPPRDSARRIRAKPISSSAPIIADPTCAACGGVHAKTDEWILCLTKTVHAQRIRLDEMSKKLLAAVRPKP